MERRHLAAVLLLTVAVLGRVAHAAQCLTALELVEQLSEGSIFAEVLATLAAEPEAVGQGKPSRGVGSVVARRLLAERAFRPCPRIAAWVCGKNGKDYSNDCVADNAGVAVECEGKCPCMDVTASGNGNAGPIDPIMGACPMIYMPVCGKDGRNYSNKCTAGGGGKVACEGACPCKPLTSASSDEGKVVPSTGAAGDNLSVADDGMGAIVCIDVYKPVCGTDGSSYVNSCRALSEGMPVACNGECPCPDLVKALDSGGGLLLVPTDDALLTVVGNSTDASGEWMTDLPFLKQLVARHIILKQNQPGMGGQVLQPSMTGTSAGTEAAQAVKLYSANKQGPASVVVGSMSAPDSIAVLEYLEEKGCDLAVLQIEAPLQGPLGTGL